MEFASKPIKQSKIDQTLNEVQKKIYGKRVEDLTPTDINRLFQVPINAEFNLILYRALERKAIDPDIAILQAIPRSITREYLIPISMCLRFGADPNMYVNVTKLGTIHILGYVYYTLGGDRFSDSDIVADQSILNTIVLMLIVKGSRSSHPMFDKNAGKITNEFNTRSQSLSVIEWLNDQGYSNILDKVNVTDPAELQKVVDRDSLTQLSIYLDYPLLSPRKYEPRDMANSIRAHSHSVFNQIPPLDTVVMMDHKSLDDAVVYLNATAYSKLLEHGQVPSYLLINKLLIDMRHYKDYGGIIATKELEYMLLRSVEAGSQLDPDQRIILSILGKDILDSVLKAYNIPYWRKVCKNPNSKSKIPDELKGLAVSLNIDPTMSKSAICESISGLSKADKDALKEAARRRQQLRLISNVGTMNEFLNGKTPNLNCRNKSLLSHDPFDYNDIDIAYYRDDQGAIWCFESDSFAAILENGINPYNQTKIPDSFKAQIKYQLDVLKLLGIDADRGEIGIYSSHVPVTFINSIDNLTNPDKINEKISQRALQEFIRLGNQNGISSELIRSLSKDQLMASLRTIDYNINMTPLSTSHALVTTARIIDHVNQTTPDVIKSFFEALSSEKFI